MSLCMSFYRCVLRYVFMCGFVSLFVSSLGSSFGGYAFRPFCRSVFRYVGSSCVSSFVVYLWR